MCIIERIAVHNLDLHALRVAVSLYHELAVHDRDLHSLRSAVYYIIEVEKQNKFYEKKNCAKSLDDFDSMEK